VTPPRKEVFRLDHTLSMLSLLVVLALLAVLIEQIKR
jgi:hypothetical protein